MNQLIYQNEMFDWQSYLQSDKSYFHIISFYIPLFLQLVMVPYVFLPFHTYTYHIVEEDSRTMAVDVL